MWEGINTYFQDSYPPKTDGVEVGESRKFGMVVGLSSCDVIDEDGRTT